MKRLGLCFAFVSAAAALMSAQAPVARRASAASPAPPATFQKYCFECHGGAKHRGDVSIERLLKQSAQSSVGRYSSDWEKVVEMLEKREMPPPDKATLFPTDEERAATALWVKAALKAHEVEFAGDPGRVTVRRLTSAEYAYAIHDLTGIDVPVGVDASSDSVGGEGFTNFGDVQFMEDTSVERYLEGAKAVADHAILGAGPLEFYADAGKTGLELSALNRIDDLYASKGFRVVSGEGGGPFGLERYGKAFYIAWYYKHRAALGDPGATLRGLAAQEGITGRFAEHIWSAVNKPNAGYPIRETLDRWTKLAAPTADVKGSLVTARAGCEAIYKSLTTWPSWFFARGDLAAGGAGDESPLTFDDTTLKAESAHHYAYGVGRSAGRRGGPPTPGPAKVFLGFTNINPMPAVKPVVLWRN
ncbi:MAG: DUF1587 domain-containing protein, partial [Acidobacteriota bacterium]